MRRAILMLACLAVLGGAAPAGAFPAGAAAKVRVGMTEDEVVRLLGPPDVRLYMDGQLMLLWSQRKPDKGFLRSKPRAKALALVFTADGRMARPFVKIHHVDLS